MDNDKNYKNVQCNNNNYERSSEICATLVWFEDVRVRDAESRYIGPLLARVRAILDYTCSVVTITLTVTLSL